MQNKAYLLFGPEEGKKQDYIDKIKKGVISLHPDCEIMVYFTFETSAQELQEVLESSSLFSSQKIVLLKEFNSPKKDLSTVICSFLKSDNDSTVLVMISDEISKNAFPKELINILSSECVIPFYELNDREKENFVYSLFSSQGFNISNDAIKLILSLVENNTLELKAFCNPIIDFFLKKAEKSITEEDISLFLSHSREENPSTLFSYISSKNLERALSSINKMLTNKPDCSIPLISSLSKYFRVLEEIHVRKKTTYDLKTIFKDVSSLQTGIYEAKGVFNINDRNSYTRALKNYSKDDCDRIVSLLYREDIQARKGERENAKLRLEMLIYNIIANNGNETRITLERELMDNSFSNL